MGIQIYDGAAWQEIKDLYRNVSGQWQSAELSRFNGTDWELLWPCHFSYTVTYPLTGYAAFSRTATSWDNINYLAVGTQTGAANSSHDSLMFFPLEQMRQDMADYVSITSAYLKLHRRNSTAGENTAYIMIGSSLSGVDPETRNKLWDRTFTELRSSYVTFARNQTRNVSISTEGIADLLSGAADCLCLPTTEYYQWDSCSYAEFEPDLISLTVTYIK